MQSSETRDWLKFGKNIFLSYVKFILFESSAFVQKFLQFAQLHHDWILCGFQILVLPWVKSIIVFFYAASVPTKGHALVQITCCF